ncbi:MAG: hypothetical protein JKY86_07495 [Gammaproteobacteria bacterium]|nr:hypothetical protein [Gammaproteobacteria bacterium]
MNQSTLIPFASSVQIPYSLLISATVKAASTRKTAGDKPQEIHHEIYRNTLLLMLPSAQADLPSVDSLEGD